MRTLAPAASFAASAETISSPPLQDVSTEAARKKRKTAKSALTRSIVGVSLEARFRTAAHGPPCLL